MTCLIGTNNHLEDSHEHMEDIFRHESKPLESYIEMNSQTKKRVIQLMIDSLNGEYGWENAVETANTIKEAEAVQ